jgi:hypothetical protein
MNFVTIEIKQKYYDWSQIMSMTFGAKQQDVKSNIYMCSFLLL